MDRLMKLQELNAAIIELKLQRDEMSNQLNIENYINMAIDFLEGIKKVFFKNGKYKRPNFFKRLLWRGVANVFWVIAQKWVKRIIKK